jgi:hypothetical protein
MSFYHLFLTYLDENDEEKKLLHHSIASEQELEAIILSIQEYRTVSIDDRSINPSKIIHLRIYQSEIPFEDLRLPDGLSPVGRQYDYIMYFFDNEMVEGIRICTDQFIIALPTEEEINLVDNDELDNKALVEDLIPEFPTLETQVQEIQLKQGSRHRSLFSIRDQEFTRKREALFFILCNFAYIGNFMLLVMLRWTELPNPTFLSTFNGDTAITFWSIISSVLIFITLFGSKHVLKKRGKSSTVLALIYSGILVGMLVINVPMNFQFMSSGSINTGFLVISYASAYLLMTGEVVIIAFTLFYDAATTLLGRELLYQELTKIVNPLLVIASATMFTGMLVTNLVLSTRYNIFFPIWFGYLFFGVVLWVLAIQLNIRKLQWQRSIEYKIQLVAEFPALPPLTSDHGWERSQLPALPPL